MQSSNTLSARAFYIYKQENSLVLYLDTKYLNDLNLQNLRPWEDENLSKNMIVAGVVK